MSDLTIDDLTAKIKMVELDIQNLSGESGRKFEVLNEYLVYLKDELKMLKSIDKH